MNQLINRICDDFETAWDQGKAIDIETILSHSDAETRDDLLEELIRLEISLLTRSGQQPNVASYHTRFPDRRQVIESAFAAPKLLDNTIDLTKNLRTQDKTNAHDTSDFATTNQETKNLQTIHRPVNTSGLHPGDHLGRYQVLQELGRGGMGAVYLANDPKLGRKVAIKIPFLTSGRADAVLQRFQREARAVAALHHPNICPIYEVTEANGLHFMVMAFIDGRPLSDYLKKSKQLKIQTAITLTRKLALTLYEAHQKGIVHRDLKPANVMIDSRSEPQIMDFGLARLDDVAASQLTADGQILGTPAYMPPEQISGDVDATGPACDVYSLGVMLYEMITGRLPFQGDLMSLMFKIVNETPASLSLHRSEVPEWLDKVCATAMAKRPEHRFPSMKAFADALKNGSMQSTGEASLQSATTNSQPISITSQPSFSSAPDRPVVDGSRNRVPGNRNIWIAAAAALPLLLLAGGWIIKITKSDGTVQEISVDASSKVEIVADQTQPTDPIAMAPTRIAATARATAEEILKSKGSVTIKIDQTDLFEQVTDPAKLPNENFSIIEVTLAGDEGNEQAVLMLAELGTVTHLLSDSQKSLNLPALRNLHKIKSLQWIFLNAGFDADDDIFSSLKSIRLLDSIGFWYNSVTDVGLSQLNRFPALRYLKLGGGSYNGSGLKELLPLPEIEEVSFAYSKFANENIPYLDRFSGLRTLDLRGCYLTSTGILTLPILQGLDSLDLSGNKDIDEECFPAIERLPNLKQLRLSETGFSDTSLEMIGTWKNLELLEIVDCKVTPAAVEKLRKTLPNCEILTQYQR